MAVDRVLGIDLGTTNSCMAMILDGELTVLNNREGARTTPSVVSYGRDGEVTVGTMARRQAVVLPNDTLFSIKRLMGRKLADPAVGRDRALFPFEIVAADNGDAWPVAQGQRLSPPEVAAQVLRKLKIDAEAICGEPVNQAVITVPAYFSDAQRQATKDAGRIAGLEVLRILNEPTAASLACGLDQRKDQTIVVYDLGGGTFDITLLRLAGGVFEVRATTGDTHLGGDDWDHAIIRILIDEFKKLEGIDLTGDRMALQRLKEAAEQAKIDLSWQLQAEVSLPFLAMGPEGPVHLTYSLTRDAFVVATKALVEATLKPCEDALREAHLTKEQVDVILLVGGMTRVPEIRRRVAEFFGKPAHPGVDPDEAVAIGAAIQGGILKGQVRDKLLLDVTPMSLGVRVTGGMMSRLIDRNTTVPTRKTITYTTANDMQTSVRIGVYQGEAPLAADNIFMGDFELVGIKADVRGAPQIDVTFDIDANGILKVKAFDKFTKLSQSIRIEPNSGLDEAQLAKMVDSAKAHSKIAKVSGEAAQYRLTCQKLAEEIARELQLPDLPSTLDKVAFEAELQVLKDQIKEAELDHLKALLKELNQALLRLRVVRKHFAGVVPS